MEEYNIDDYDLFIFDFDGTIMNTEPYHYKTYLKAIKEYKSMLEKDLKEIKETLLDIGLEPQPQQQNYYVDRK